MYKLLYSIDKGLTATRYPLLSCRNKWHLPAISSTISPMDFPVPLSPKYIKLAEELNVRPEDIVEYIARGGGPGGQKINKASISVELKHVPTGTRVRVQRYRQQSTNRLSAYHRLLLKIEVLKKGKESEIRRKKYKKHKQKQRRSRRSKEKMLEEKHHRSAIKEKRKEVEEE